VSPVPKEHVDQMRGAIHEILGATASDIFIGRIDGIINDWVAGKISAAQACEKVQKMVALFVDEQKAREIGYRCAPIVMRESVQLKK
jgi:hypothetical protein